MVDSCTLGRGGGWGLIGWRALSAPSTSCAQGHARRAAATAGTLIALEPRSGALLRARVGALLCPHSAPPSGCCAGVSCWCTGCPRASAARPRPRCKSLRHAAWFSFARTWFSKYCPRTNLRAVRRRVVGGRRGLARQHPQRSAAAATPLAQQPHRAPLHQRGLAAAHLPCRGRRPGRRRAPVGRRTQERRAGGRAWPARRPPCCFKRLRPAPQGLLLLQSAPASPAITGDAPPRCHPPSSTSLEDTVCAANIVRMCGRRHRRGREEGAQGAGLGARVVSARSRPAGWPALGRCLGPGGKGAAGEVGGWAGE